MKYSIQIVGVGGQGVLLASMVLGNAAMEAGYEVAMSEVHGMAQRGGSVLCTLRFGDKVISPLESIGGADLYLPVGDAIEHDLIAREGDIGAVCHEPCEALVDIRAEVT